MRKLHVNVAPHDSRRLYYKAGDDEMYDLCFVDGGEVAELSTIDSSGFAAEGANSNLSSYLHVDGQSINSSTGGDHDDIHMCMTASESRRDHEHRTFEAVCDAFEAQLKLAIIERHAAWTSAAVAEAVRTIACQEGARWQANLCRAQLAPLVATVSWSSREVGKSAILGSRFANHSSGSLGRENMCLGHP
jgi:hypothetical protein